MKATWGRISPGLPEKAFCLRSGAGKSREQKYLNWTLKLFIWGRAGRQQLVPSFLTSASYVDCTKPLI